MYSERSILSPGPAMQLGGVGGKGFLPLPQFRLLRTEFMEAGGLGSSETQGNSLVVDARPSMACPP